MLNEPEAYKFFWYNWRDAFEFCCKLCKYKENIEHDFFWMHWFLISRLASSFNRFIQFNQQNLHIFLLKSVPPNSVVFFVLFAIEFSFITFITSSETLTKSKSHFEIWCSWYNHLAWGDYSKIWHSLQPIRASAYL